MTAHKGIGTHVSGIIRDEDGANVVSVPDQFATGMTGASTRIPKPDYSLRTSRGND